MHQYSLYIVIFLWLLGLPSAYAKNRKQVPDSLQVLSFEVNGVPFNMQRVESGVFIMGGTPEQHRERISTDRPTHTVALDAYYIAPSRKNCRELVIQKKTASHETVFFVCICLR